MWVHLRTQYNKQTRIKCVCLLWWGVGGRGNKGTKNERMIKIQREKELLLEETRRKPKASINREIRKTKKKKTISLLRGFPSSKEEECLHKFAKWPPKMVLCFYFFFVLFDCFRTCFICKRKWPRRFMMDACCCMLYAYLCKYVRG